MRLFRRIIIGVAASALLIPATASALATATAAQQGALQSQITAAQPFANATVASAASAGTLGTIVNQISSDPANAYGGPSPMDYALGVALEKYGSAGTASASEVTGTDPLAIYDTDTGDSTAIPANDSADPVTVNAAASKTTCWHVGSHVSNYAYYKEAGQAVIKLTKGHNYWCGNGYSITSNGIPGFYSTVWDQFPWCAGNVQRMTGWDAPHSQWAHSRIQGKYGLLTPWFACAGFFGSGGITLRIAANGHYDWYNDF